MSRREVRTDDFGDEEAFLAAIDEVTKYFNDGDIVEGVIVNVGSDEVLVDIGYKTEGVIPLRELSSESDVDPHTLVSVGDEIEALVLQKQDKEGRLILSKKRAQQEWTGSMANVEPSNSRGQLARAEKELSKLRRQLAVKEEELSKLRKQLADKEKERRALEALREQEDTQRQGEFDELRASADGWKCDAEDARSVARRVWAAMPPDGRLAYFESGSSWLPQWIVRKEE